MAAEGWLERSGSRHCSHLPGYGTLAAPPHLLDDLLDYAGPSRGCCRCKFPISAFHFSTDAPYSSCWRLAVSWSPDRSRRNRSEYLLLQRAVRGCERIKPLEVRAGALTAERVERGLHLAYATRPASSVFCASSNLPAFMWSATSFIAFPTCSTTSSTDLTYVNAGSNSRTYSSTSFNSAAVLTGTRGPTRRRSSVGSASGRPRRPRVR